MMLLKRFFTLSTYSLRRLSSVPPLAPFSVAVEQRLLNDQLYRYLSLDQLVDVTSGLSNANKGNVLMFETFEKVFIKHRLALDEDKADVIRKAFEDKKLGSNLLFKVLENPKAEFKEEKKTIGQHH